MRYHVLARPSGEPMKPCGVPRSNRFRYQAALAERQFNRVDPDNRLVAGNSRGDGRLLSSSCGARKKC
jgi:hypothetical protein